MFIDTKGEKLVGDKAIVAALKAPDEDGNILIHYAKNIRVLNFLLSKAKELKCGNLVRFRRRDGDTPLHYACEKGVLRTFCTVCNAECAHANPLRICSLCTHTNCEHDAVKYCMQCISDGEKKRKICHHEKQKIPLMVKSLIYHGADVNAKNKALETPIMFAAKHNYTEIIELLLNHGANVDQKDDDNYTALLVAAENGNIKATELLLRNGACIEDTEKHDRNMIFLAASEDNFEYLKYLFEQSPCKEKMAENLNQRDNYSNTALHVAAEKGYYKLGF